MTQAIYQSKKNQIAQSEMSDSKKEFEKYALWVEYINQSVRKSKL